MSAQDIFHQATKNALIKDGWTITHDPLFLSVGGIEMFVDLGAEKLIAAEKNGQKSAVEVKSFAGSSNISEFHMALGQFLDYEQALEEKHPERVLYLAVPEGIFTIHSSGFSLFKRLFAAINSNLSFMNRSRR